MTKFIIILLSLLLLLTACQSSADPPIAPQETTAGVIDPEETTGEPQETTAEETTEEETTAEETTAEETTALQIDKDWVNQAEPAEYRYLEGLPEDKWYFSWTPDKYMRREMKTTREFYPLRDESEAFVFLTPLRYEVEQDGLLFRFEFFETKHVANSFMQIRATVINCSDETMMLQDNPCATFMHRVDDKSIRRSEVLWLSPEDERSLSQSYSDYRLSKVPLKLGESMTIERIMVLYYSEMITPEYTQYLYYTVDHWYSGQAFESIEVAIPITVVLPETKETQS